MGQWANPRPSMHRFGPVEPHEMPAALPASENDLRAGGDIVWSENFANGLAGNNGSGAWTTSGPHGNIWKRTTGNPVGAFSGNAAAARIQSTTVSNGYMIFNSDSANCNCTTGGAAAWPANPTSWDGALESPVIDLSATPFVQLQYQQRLRWCCQTTSPHVVEISTDGGATWPTSFPAVPDGQVNQLTATQTIGINITNAIAANPANVKIRFKHNPIAAAYHWQLDDIRIIELFEYDMRLTGTGITRWDPNSAATYDSIRYSVYPFNQLRPLGLNMTVQNNGSATQTSAVANFTVQRGGTTVLDQDQALAPLVPGEERVVFVNPSFTPPAVAGTYNVSMSVTSTEEDQTPTDNTGTGSFAVSQYVYARDRGTVASTQAAGTGPLILANAFYVPNAAQLHSISVALGTGSELGSLVVGEVRADNLDDVIATSEETIVTTSMLNQTGAGNFINLIFNPPVSLQPGIDYMAAVQVFGDVRIGQNGTSEPQTSFIYFEGQAGLDWYFTTTTPMVRMNFDPTVGITERDATNSLGLGQNMPNPADVRTTIPFQLSAPANVTLRVHDVTGKLVSEEYLGSRAAGVYRHELNTSVLRNGVYFYTLGTGTAQVTKRMLVVH